MAFHVQKNKYHSIILKLNRINHQRISLSESQRLRLILKTWRLTESKKKDWPRQKEPHQKKKRILWCCQVQTFGKDLDCSNHMQTQSEAKWRNVRVMALNLWKLPTIDMIIKFKVKMIASSPFRKQFCLGDLTMPEYQVPRWGLALLRIWLTNPCNNLINSCKTYKNVDQSVTQRDEFQGNDVHVALVTLGSKSFIEFWCSWDMYPLLLCDHWGLIYPKSLVYTRKSEISWESCNIYHSTQKKQVNTKIEDWQDGVIACLLA